MRTAYFAFILALLSGVAASPLQQNAALNSRDQMNLGVHAYKDGKYSQAIDHFEKALALDPANRDAELYLATAYYIQWVPGAESPDNRQNHDLAAQHFNNVLGKNPADAQALAMLASMAFNQAQVGTPEEKAAALDEAKKLNERRIEANPENPEPYYYLGVIAWSKAFAPIHKARVEAGMRPSDLGPFKDPNLRNQLQRQFWSIIVEGLDDLKRCLQIDKENEDAMAYMNLLLRTKADLEDSETAAKEDIAKSDEWFNKSLELKRLKAARPPLVAETER